MPRKQSRREIGEESQARTQTDSGDLSYDEEIPDVYTGHEEIQVDFEGRDPEESDFHGVKALLQQLFLKAHINLSDLANIITGENFVGSVLQQSESDTPEDDDDDDEMESGVNDVFGVTTVVSLKHKQNSESVQQMKQLLIKLVEEHAGLPTRALMEKVVSGNTGLLLNERLVNIPPQVSVPLFETLQSEVAGAKDKNDLYKFDYYLMICKLYKQESNNKGNKKNINKDPEVIWSNAEEEVINSMALDGFEFSVKDQSDSGLTGNWLEEDSAMTPYRKVLILEANKFKKVIDAIKSFVV